MVPLLQMSRIYDALKVSGYFTESILLSGKLLVSLKLFFGMRVA